MTNLHAGYIAARRKQIQRDETQRKTVDENDDRANIQQMFDHYDVLLAQNHQFYLDILVLTDTEEPKVEHRLEMAFRRHHNLRNAGAALTASGTVDMIAIAKNTAQPERASLELMILRWETELDAILKPFAEAVASRPKVFVETMDSESVSYRELRWKIMRLRAQISPINVCIFQHLDSKVSEPDRVRMRRVFMDQGAVLPWSIIETVCADVLQRGDIDDELRGLCVRLRDDYRAAETQLVLEYIRQDERYTDAQVPLSWTPEADPGVRKQQINDIKQDQRARLEMLDDLRTNTAEKLERLLQSYDFEIDIDTEAESEKLKDLPYSQ